MGSVKPYTILALFILPSTGFTYIKLALRGLSHQALDGMSVLYHAGRRGSQDSYT